MLRNIVSLVITALLICLFICAANFTGETAELLCALANETQAAAKAERWDDCIAFATALDAALQERIAGLKMLVDHEDVDALICSSKLILASARLLSANELELELARFCSSLEYIRDIDKLLWINYL